MSDKEPLFKKPDGVYLCRACGLMWSGADLGVDPFHFGLVCGDAFCGATVVNVTNTPEGKEFAEKRAKVDAAQSGGR